MPDQALLLDTHAWVWLVTGDDRLGQESRCLIEEIAANGRLLVSAISVWEVGMLEAKGRLSFTMPVERWMASALSLPGLACVDVTPEVALEAARLRGDFHGDPADRLIIATARVRQVAMGTRDKRIQDYASRGAIRLIPI